MLWRSTVWFVGVIVLGGGLAMQAWPDAAPQMRQLHVHGVDLSYLEQGTGAPVVFVHGAPSHLRYWEPQRQAVATQYHFIAANLRYHGTAPWPDEGQHYSVATHAADLAAFLRHLNVGPVHLVAISYGGFPATLVALEHPDLVRSLSVLEPAMGALLADIPEAKPVRDAWGKAFAPIRTAAQAGDVQQAATLLFDFVDNQGPGTFEQQPEAVR